MDPAHTLMFVLAGAPSTDWMRNDAGSSLPEVFRHEPQGLGVGIYMGTPTGLAALNLSLRTGRSTQQVYLNWNTQSGAFRLVTDQLLVFYDVPSDEDLRFPLYWGMRGWVTLNEINNNLGFEGISQTLGVGLPVGISMYNDRIAVDLYFECAPVLQILPSSRLGFQAGIGFRMYPALPFIKTKKYKQ